FWSLKPAAFMNGGLYGSIFGISLLRSRVENRLSRWRSLSISDSGQLACQSSAHMTPLYLAAPPVRRTSPIRAPQLSGGTYVAEARENRPRPQWGHSSAGEALSLRSLITEQPAFVIPVKTGIQ